MSNLAILFVGIGLIALLSVMVSLSETKRGLVVAWLVFFAAVALIGWFLYRAIW